MGAIPHTTGTEQALPDGTAKLSLTWDDVHYLSRQLADKVEAYSRKTGERFDVMAILPRGSYYSANLLSRWFGFKADQLVHACITSYGDGEMARKGVRMGQMPRIEDIAGKCVLVVEEVCDTGHTLAHLKDYLEMAGAKLVRVATLHYKPEKSQTGFVPDIWAAVYNGWIEYPWEAAEAAGKQSYVNSSNKVGVAKPKRQALAA